MVIGRSAKNKQAPDASGMASTPGARVRRETSPVREGANINAVIVLPPRKHVNAGGLGTPIPAPPLGAQQYRLGGRKGRTRRVTIGRHGEVTPSFARAEAKRLLGEIAAGRDPAAERDKARADKAVAMVFDQFMAEHVRPKLKTSAYRSSHRPDSKTRSQE